MSPVDDQTLRLRDWKDNLQDDLKRIFDFTEVAGVLHQNVVLAQVRAREWCSIETPGVSPGPVTICPACGHDRETPVCRECGSDTQVLPLRSGRDLERSERLEDRRVGSQAARDLLALDRLLPAFHAELVIAFHSGGATRELAKVAEPLAVLVTRYTQTVDARVLDEEPECRSCARPGKVGNQRYPGFKGVGVYAKAKKHRLCRWCYDRWIVKKQLPPLDLIDIYHTQGPRQAGVEEARREREAERKAS